MKNSLLNGNVSHNNTLKETALTLYQVSPKNVTCRNFDLSKCPKLTQQYVKATSIFPISDVLFTNIGRFEKTPSTMSTLSLSKYCYVKHYLSERCFHFSDQCLKKCTLQNATLNKYLPRLFKNGPF